MPAPASTTADALLNEARFRDAADPAPFRDRFEFPPMPATAVESVRAHTDVAYFAGNSLGLLPRSARESLQEVLTSWSARGVTGHFTGPHPWSGYPAELEAPMARVVGADPHEVVVMNTLTVNLHLLMAAFYRPSGRRTRIVIEAGAFPSDDYAVASQARHHGLDPDDAVVRLTPRQGESLLRTEDVVASIEQLDGTVALVLLSGINFRTGQLFDIEAITQAGHRVGAVVGWDLAHAAGNVPLRLHDWNVDFASWCTYKYMNSGPGAIAAAFVHARHVDRPDLVRLTGWWGNATTTRFEMKPDFEPQRGAQGWQVSNPPILAMAPIRASLELFDAVGMATLRARSLRLTAYLEELFDAVRVTHRLDQLTTRDPTWRGAQLSMLVDDAIEVTEQLIDGHGVVPDDRPPNIVRFAPPPLYGSYEDCARAAIALREVLPER